MYSLVLTETTVRKAPFFIGGPIPTAQAAEFLHGYEEERRTLVQYLNRKAPFRLGVLGNRGSGKTSLLLAIAPQISQNRVHVECTRLWPATIQAFYRLLVEAFGFPPPSAPVPDDPAQAYRMLPVPRKGSRGILVLENADALNDLNPGLVAELPQLTARLPLHIVLTGQAQVLRPLVEDAVELQPFRPATAADFLQRRFATVGMTLEDEAYPVFQEFTRGQPSVLQRLAYAVWENAVLGQSPLIRAEDVERAVSELVDHLPSETLAPWTALRGIMRDVFIAMCRHDLESPTGIARRLGLEPKNVIVLLSRLADAHGVVERVERGVYRVRDPLLKHYVRKEWGSPLLR